MTSRTLGMTPRRMAVALAFVALGIAPILPHAAAVGQVTVPGSCAKYADPWGWGGSHVECKLSCLSNAGLAMAAFAEDTDATVSGSYNCGNMSAGCPPTRVTCAGASQGLTSYEEKNQTCEADTDETWDSGVYVACAVIGGTPGDESAMEIICRAVPQFPGCGNLLEPTLLQRCQNASPGGLPPGFDLSRLLPAGRNVSSFVGAYADAHALVEVGFSSLPTPTCTVHVS